MAVKNTNVKREFIGMSVTPLKPAPRLAADAPGKQVKHAWLATVIISLGVRPGPVPRGAQIAGPKENRRSLLAGGRRASLDNKVEWARSRSTQDVRHIEKGCLPTVLILCDF